MLFRMARLSFACLVQFLSTGEVPYLDSILASCYDITWQMFCWILWSTSMLVSNLVHPVWYTIMRFTFLHLWWFNLILPDRDKFHSFLRWLSTIYDRKIPKPRISYKRARWKYELDRLHRIHSSFLVMTGCIMIRPCDAYIFGDYVPASTRHWIASSYYSATVTLQQPWLWFMQSTPTWPPDGVILKMVLTSFALLICFLVTSHGYYRILKKRFNGSSTTSSSSSDPSNDPSPQQLQPTQPQRITLPDVPSTSTAMRPCTPPSSPTREVSQIPSSVVTPLEFLPVVNYTVSQALSTKEGLSKHLESNNTNFDNDTIRFVLDNCANVHIVNDPEIFESIGPTETPRVATIGGDPLTPKGQGTCNIRVKNDRGEKIPIQLLNVLYFPQSPVNIISIAQLSDSFDDTFDTKISTARYHSDFQWNFGKFKRTIHHSFTRIPEIDAYPISDGWKSFYNFSNSFEKSLYTTAVFATPTCTIIPENKPNYVSDDDDESPLSSKERPPSLNDGPYSPWQPGQKLAYTKDGHTDEVTVDKIELSDDNLCIRYSIRLSDGRIIPSTKEFLRDLSEDDAFKIPTSMEEYKTAAAKLDEDAIRDIMNPRTLTPLEQEFMDTHHSLQHAPYKEMFRLAEFGHLPKRFLRLKKKPPICASCIFSSMKRKAWKRNHERSTTVRKLEHNRPGKGTSVDQLISAQPGLVPRISGRHTRQRIQAATVFLDHYSDFSYTHLCTSTSQEETLEAKAAYEKLAASHGVTVKHYHADNGRFAEKGFRDVVHASNQTISFCAVNAHHQNGLIENFIGQLARGGRTLLLHAKRHWPEAIGTILWPFAIKAFEDRRNHWHLDNEGKSPLQKFSSTYHNQEIKNWHTFGCPVFVLEEKAANGKMPKWDPRSRVGIYLGHSPCHAGSVALVLNPRTLHVSPQYHVVFDDQFTTVPYMKNGEVPPHWEELVNSHSESVTDEKIELANTWAETLSPDMTEDTPFAEDVNLQLSRSYDPSKITPQLPLEDKEKETDPFKVSEGDKLPRMNNPPPRESTPKDGEKNASFYMPEVPDLDALTARRSTRTRSAPKRLSFFTLFSLVTIGSVFTSLFCNPQTYHDRAMAHMTLINQHFDGTLNYIHPLALATKNADNDTFTLKEMMKQDDKTDFIKAMMTELMEHESRNHWTVIQRSNLPLEAKTILAIWSFKRKRFPDGRIMKYKARLCAHGGMQKWGVDYWETYSPVVNWVTVRTLMALSQIHGLETKSIDFVLAFPQADLDTDVFMELPFGFDVDGSRNFVLKLNKSLYGLKNSSRNWFQHLTNGLKNRGFTPSQVDPCVLYREDCIILVYVDDCIIFSRSKTINDSIVTSLQNGPENFQLTDEGDLNRYLGVDIVKKKDGSFELRQPFLIERCLKAMEIDDKMNPKSAPATKPLLHKDKDGDPRKYSWNYRQVIGMLNYLQGSTRPDIAMATHQCARFSADPKASHERAVRYIGKYLLGTKDRGIIYRPNPKKGIECYVDADFAGGWAKADADNPENVLSRSGYTVYYAGCPVMWSSRLQTEIALSTAESEYIALSSAMREVIPLMSLLTEVNCIFEVYNPEPKVMCKIFEDNESCIAMAKTQKFSPRTRHISLKYHHFRRFVEKGIIEIHSIDTAEQTADIFTKPLVPQTFTYLRKKLCGW